MDNNRETSADADVVFEYTGVGCSVPRDITSVRFIDGLQKIGNGAFCNCSSLESIKLPYTVTEIGYETFRNCISLKEVILNDGLQKIRAKAFFKCTSLKSITVYHLL